MRALVVYESMYGQTRAVADAIGVGLSETYETRVGRAAEVGPTDLEGVDLLVVGGPTHVHGMADPRSRQGAVAALNDPSKGLQLEDGATDPGVREFLKDLGDPPEYAAAFDTRVDIAKILSGAASTKIAHRLRKAGCTLVAEPESFLVGRSDTVLEAGELDRARQWGAALYTRIPVG